MDKQCVSMIAGLFALLAGCATNPDAPRPISEPVATTAPPPETLAIVAGSCKPFDGIASEEVSIELLEVSPRQGALVARDAMASIQLRYRFPASLPPSHYMLAVAFDTATPGMATMPLPIEFPFPATCGPMADMTVTVLLDVGSSAPTPTTRIGFRFVIFEGEIPGNIRSVAQSNSVEYAKRRDDTAQ